MSIESIWKLVLDGLDYVGRFSTALVIVAVIAAIYGWAKGILPAVLRLGNGLSKRKIVIFASGDHANSLRDLLADSKIFKSSNIICVSSKSDIGRAENLTLYLIQYADCASYLEDILRIKNDKTALVVYAPKEQGIIPDNDLIKLNDRRNVTVNNLRGRLLNDLVVSMITTSYER